MEKMITINGETSLFIYKTNILNDIELEELIRWINLQKFKSGHCLTGKEVPRQQIWYQKDRHYFCDSWKVKYDRWVSESYDPILEKYESIINCIVNDLLSKYFDKINIDADIIKNPVLKRPLFNSCLINKYRDGNDSIHPHRDTADSFGEYPIIAGVSLGHERNMLIKKIIYNNDNKKSLKHDRDEKINLNIPLVHNSLFIMTGASQKYFTHEIPKNNSNGVRYSLTFREFIK